MISLEIKRIPSSLSGQHLHTLVWTPKNPTAVLQIVHGMSEHISRYNEFARWMCERNIAVIGHSHLGHGLTAKTEDDLGFIAPKNSWQHLTDDLHLLRLEAQRVFPGLPHFILGHSMGSFVARTYLTRPAASGLSGVILSGTGHQTAALMTTADAVSGIIQLFCGKRHRSPLIHSLSFGGYNKAFKPKRTDFDWLSCSNENVDRYEADPLCGFCFTTSAFRGMFKGLKFIALQKSLSSMPKSTPCLLISGKDDPVGENGKGVEHVANMLLSAGMNHVDVKLYEGFRHEVLNETERERVFGDVYAFIRSSMKSHEE